MNENAGRQIREMENLKDILTYSCQKYSDQTAYLEKNKETNKYEPVTFQEFHDCTIALGTALCSELALKGKRIAIISENRYQWMISYLAVVCGTGVVVPIDRSLFSESEVSFMLTKAQCEAVIFSESKKDMILEVAKSLPFIKHLICMDDDIDQNEVKSFWRLVDSGRKLVANGDRTFVDSEINAEAMTILLYTSGTTSTSKAVMLSHRNIATNIYSVSGVIDLREGDVTYSLLPLHHTYECMVELMFLYNGASIAVCEGLRHIPNNLQEVKPELLITVPSFLDKVVKKIVLTMEKDGKQQIADIIKREPQKLASLPEEVKEVLFKAIKGNFGGNLRLVFSGAAPLPDRLREFFQTVGIAVLVGYGLTETSPVNTLLLNNESAKSSIGKAIPGVQVRISNPGEDGSGEICVKGPNVMIGYMDDEEATREVIDSDGWFATGDMGFIDEEGFVHINGRKKEMIGLPNGKKVFPQDIEPFFDEYPVIKEAVICNMSAPGEKEKVGVIMVFDEEIYQELSEKDARTPEKMATDIMDEVNGKIAVYKRIRGVKLRKEEFPKTTTSKIKRHLIKWADA